MKISELFYSIQGEGRRAGLPSFFIRTNFCNLRCKFPGGNLCDTPYTSWNPNDENNAGEMEISGIIEEYKKFNCSDIVITGGEPTMYPADLRELCIELKNANSDCIITLETNGTAIGDFAEYIDLFSVSPKLSTSVPYGVEHEKMHEKNRINAEVLGKINELEKGNLTDAQWKFVFTGEEDLKEIFELRDLIGFANKDIYLMPEGVTREDLDKRREKTIQACLKHGLNYTDRLHIVVWGDRRGV